MLIENTEVYGFKAAIRGLRNPADSWDKSDSEFGLASSCQRVWGFQLGKWITKHTTSENPYIGPKDLTLAKKLIKAGTEHRKFLRQIMIWVDFTLPRYVWTEFDTYKVGITRNSCSTMHKLGSRPLVLDDFEDQQVMPEVLTEINRLAEDHRNKNILREGDPAERLAVMKGLLPESYLQKATITMNYENALNIYYQRKNHRLKQWKESNPKSICSWIKSLPYVEEFIED